MGGAITDNFNRTDNASSLNTSSSGHAWVALVGTWGVNSNRGYLPAAEPQSVAYIEASESDCTVEVTLLTSNSSNLLSRQGMAFRISDASNYFYFYWINNSVLRCYKFVAGSETQLFTQNITAADNDVLKVVLLGDQIEIYHNDDLKDTITESFNQSATKHGLFWQVGGSAASIARWEDFSVE